MHCSINADNNNIIFFNLESLRRRLLAFKAPNLKPCVTFRNMIASIRHTLGLRLTWPWPNHDLKLTWIWSFMDPPFGRNKLENKLPLNDLENFKGLIRNFIGLILPWPCPNHDLGLTWMWSFRNLLFGSKPTLCRMSGTSCLVNSLQLPFSGDRLLHLQPEDVPCSRDKGPS